MKTYYDIIKESADTETVFAVVGKDGSIASVWPNKEDAVAEKDKMNAEVGGNYFDIKESPAEEFIAK